MKRSTLGQSSQEFRINPYRKKRTCSQVSASHPIIQWQRVTAQGTIDTITNKIENKTFILRNISSDNAIAQNNSQRCSRDHH